MIRMVLAVLAVICATALGRAQEFSAEELDRRTIHRRAVEAVIWGMPAVNYELMRQALIDSAKGMPNQVVYYSHLPDWKNQTLTPNPDTIYFIPFYDTQSGPVVLEIPPANGGEITGSVDSGWQTAIEDVGPAGVDKGKGGKYLILPPGYGDPVPDGYIPMPSETFAGFAILRSNIGSGSDADIAKAVDYGKQIRLYPLSDAASPPPTTFVDVVDVVFDSTIPYDLRFFETLNRFVQREPWLERDKAMIDQLSSIGIEKGKTFGPDEGTQDILKGAAAEAHAWLDARYGAVFSPPYSTGRAGRYPHRQRSSRLCPRTSRSQTVIPSMAAASRSHSLTSARSISGRASST